MIKNGIAYALGGEDLCAAVVAPTALGLPLPDRGAGAFGVADDGGGGGGTAAVLCTEGEVVGAGAETGAGMSGPYEGLSWGAGDGAIAIAVLMIDRLRWGCVWGKIKKKRIQFRKDQKTKWRVNRYRLPGNRGVG